MPASSNTDLSLTKAEPSSDGAGIAGMTVKKGQKNLQVQVERGVRGAAMQTPRCSRKEGRGGAPCAKAETPLQPW